MKKILVLFAFLAIGASSLSAQKYAHLNLGELISGMPETKTADSELEIYQKGLIAKGEEMATNFQKAYGEFVALAQSGDMTPKQQQERQTALQKQQQEILAYEQEIQQKVQQRRSELLQPIFDRAEAAIKEVAKEKGYVLIFDTSVFNAVLFAQDADDVMAVVKAKMGVK